MGPVSQEKTDVAVANKPVDANVAETMPVSRQKTKKESLKQKVVQD